MFAGVTNELCIVWSCRENVERFEGRSETYAGTRFLPPRESPHNDYLALIASRETGLFTQSAC